MSNWKQTFKAHRIAANGQNIEDNFIYHREGLSFPSAMPVPRKKTGQSSFGRPGALGNIGRRLLPAKRLLKRILPNNVISVFGFGLPLVGIGVIVTFMANNVNTSDEVVAA